MNRNYLSWNIRMRSGVCNRWHFCHPLFFRSNRWHFCHPLFLPQKNYCTGYYVHADIAYAVAMWMSPKYLVKVISIVKAKERRYWEKKEQQARNNIRRLKKDNGNLQNVVNETRAQLNEINTALQNGQATMNEIRQIMQQQTQDNRELRRGQRQLQQTVNNIQTDIHSAIEQIGPKQTPEKQTKYIVWDLNVDEYSFWQMGGQLQQIHDKHAELIQEFPAMREIYSFNDATPIAICRHIRKRLQENNEWIPYGVDMIPPVHGKKCRFGLQTLSSDDLLAMVVEEERKGTNWNGRQY